MTTSAGGSSEEAILLVAPVYVSCTSKSASLDAAAWLAAVVSAVWMSEETVDEGDEPGRSISPEAVTVRLHGRTLTAAVTGIDGIVSADETDTDGEVTEHEPVQPSVPLARECTWSQSRRRPTAGSRRRSRRRSA